MKQQHFVTLLEDGDGRGGSSRHVHVPQRRGFVGLPGFFGYWSLGLIRGEAEGFWQLDMTAQHFAAWAKCVRRIHAEGRPARAVADLRRAQTQSQEVASLVQREIADLYREGDPVAVVLPSGLLKTQIRRILSSEISRYFDDIDEAERWALCC